MKPLLSNLLRNSFLRCPVPSLVGSGLALAGLLATCLAAQAECLSWNRAFPVHYPGKRYGHAMTYDSDRGVVVFFGGEFSEPGGSSSFFNDTWEYDGLDWRKISFPTNAPLPNPRQGHAIAYDAARHAVVLFGGADASTYYGDTWVYRNDGTNASWTQVFVNGPARRAGHAMVYDSQRQLCIVAGGTLDSGHEEAIDSFGWNGSSWVFLDYATVSITGHFRSRFGMAYDSDRGVTVAYGGVWYFATTVGHDSSVMSGTSEFNGHWYDATGGEPPFRQQNAMAYFQALGKTVNFGGTGAEAGIGDDTDVYTAGVGWSSLFTSGPPPRARHAMVYDSSRRRIVLYGGVSGDVRYDDTYELSTIGPVFTRQPTNQSVFPCAPASFTAIATGAGPLQYQWFKDGLPLTDDGRISGATTNTLVISSVRVSDDGAYQLGVISACGTNTSAGARLKVLANWVQQTPAAKPAGRRNAALAYDSARGVTVLFGGIAVSGNSSRETYEWNGNTWLLRSMSGPIARAGHGMAYDSDRKRMVLFGGSYNAASAYYTLGDTWEYDGGKWILRATNGPSSRMFPAMAYDTATHKTVLYGGVWNGASWLYDTWEYDGNAGSWTQVSSGLPGGTQLSQRVPQMTFDQNQQKRVLIDMYNQGIVFAELRVFEWDGAQWVRRTPMPDPDRMTERVPTPASGFGLAYDSAQRMVIMNNGLNVGGFYPSTTWGYDGTYWRLQSGDGPGPLSDGALAYDSARNALVEFGGWRNDVPGYYWDQTWEMVHADAPQFIHQPVAKSLPTGAIQVSVTLRGMPPYQFQWRKDGLPLSEGSQYSGTTNGVLTMVGSPSGLFDVVVAGNCGPAASFPILLPLAVSPVSPHGQTQLTISNALDSIAVRWPDPTARLYSASSVTGAWSLVSGATSPYSSPIGAAPKFFQLQGGSGCANMPSGLVTWLRAEGNANDSTGLNNGSLLAGLGFTNGEVGQTFNFTNNGQGISLPASASLNLATNGDFTIEAWINPADVNTPRPIAEWNSGAAIGAHFWLTAAYGGSGGPGGLYAALNPNADPAIILGSVPGLLASNTWQHVAFVYRAHDPVFASMELFLNGQSVAAQSVAAPVVQTQYPLNVGIRPGSAYYRGLMDELTFYKRALTPAELTAISAAGPAGKCLP